MLWHFWKIRRYDRTPWYLDPHCGWILNETLIVVKEQIYVSLYRYPRLDCHGPNESCPSCRCHFSRPTSCQDQKGSLGRPCCHSGCRSSVRESYRSASSRTWRRVSRSTTRYICISLKGIYVTDETVTSLVEDCFALNCTLNSFKLISQMKETHWEFKTDCISLLKLFFCEMLIFAKINRKFKIYNKNNILLMFK